MIEVNEEFKEFLKTCSVIELGIILGDAELADDKSCIEAVQVEFKIRMAEIQSKEEAA